MKIVQINSFSNGSTGKIMMSIHKELLKQGHESYVVWGRGRKAENEHEIFMNDKIGVYFHALYSRLTGKTGFASKRATKKLIKKIEEINPDVIHLHNIHGYYINIEMLFNYLKKIKAKKVWTLHDCWAFTGQCPHFTYVKCDKWKSHCEKCPMINEYPKTLVDNSKLNFERKKELFTGVDNLTIVTPSDWLAGLVKESFLKEYNVEVIHNGINTNIFKPTESDFRKKYNLEDKKIILGVASVWTKKKGLYDFIELSKLLDDNYVIVLVGVNKKQLKQLPKNIIGIQRTENQIELAGLYSTSDLFFNPTYEDNYPSVNIEAIACGTKILAYNNGGNSEFSQFLNNRGSFIIKENDSNIFNESLSVEIESFINDSNKKISIDSKNVDLIEFCNKYFKVYI